MILVIKLTAPNGQPVYINPEQIVAVRALQEGEKDDRNINSMVTSTDGKLHHVVEPLELIIEKIKNAGIVSE